MKTQNSEVKGLAGRAPAHSTKAQKRAFSRRFTLDDWNRLCGRSEFLSALESDLAVAEVIAWEILVGTGGVL